MTKPTYRELLQRTDAPPGSSWGLLGDLGSISRLSRESVMRATQCVKSGDTFNLDWPLNAFAPPVAATRRASIHYIFQRHANHRDDYLDSFFLQGSSQIDGLRHFRHPEYGFYNGASDDAVQVGGGRLGVEGWSEHGIIGRGVLVDVDAFLVASRGSGLDQAAGEAFSVGVIEEAAAWEGVELRPNDVLLLRTGWTRYYFEQMTAAEREALPMELVSPGIAPEQDSLAWLWDHQLALVAADNVAVEALRRPDIRAEVRSELADGLHTSLIAMLGLAIGELWRLDELADACATDGRYEMMVISKPLNLIGGVGSPSNAMAIR